MVKEKIFIYNMLDKIMKKLKLIQQYKSAIVSVSVNLNEDDWNTFVKECNPEIKAICLSRTEKELFYVGRIMVDKQEISVYSPRFSNSDFDREACIRKCAEDRESWRIFQLHKDEIDVEGRIKKIKENKEIGCYG